MKKIELSAGIVDDEDDDDEDEEEEERKFVSYY